MGSKTVVVMFAALLLIPAHAGAQTPDRIIFLSDLGTYGHGDYVLGHGVVSATVPNASVIMQVTNPDGIMCNIQQIGTLPGGAFVTSPIALRGALCGGEGEYGIKLFYGEYTGSSQFTVDGEGIRPLDGTALFSAAKSVLDSRIRQASSASDTSAFLDRALSLSWPAATVGEVHDAYVDLLGESFTDSSLDGLDVTIKRSVSYALDELELLEEAGKLPPEAPDLIQDTLYSAMFYYEIGHVQEAGARLGDAYDSIRSTSPPADPLRPASFESLENTLLNLMQKSGSQLSAELRGELAFILARGTAPVYADELADVLDVLTYARYLDITSNRSSPLYSLVITEWNALSPALEAASSVGTVSDLKDDIEAVYDAAFLLRDLERVEEFVAPDRGPRIGECLAVRSSDLCAVERSDAELKLGELLRPAWDALSDRLASASSVSDIHDNAEDIRDMKAIIDISSRLAYVIRLTEANGVDSEVTQRWPGLLDRVGLASSLSEVRSVVSEFNESIAELEDLRNPLDELRLEYRGLRAKAEQQSDRRVLADIDNAFTIISLAERLSAGHQTPITSARIEVLLAWAVTESSEIAEKLASYSDEDRKARASDVLTRAQSLENLAETGLRTKRFVPGYSDYADEVLATVARVRALVIGEELNQADEIIRRAFEEWTAVAAEYRDDPPSSGEYGIIDITKRKYQKHVDDLGNIASEFLKDGTTESREFTRLLDRAAEFTKQGNFVDAQEWITQAYEYAQEHLDREHNSVIYDLDYDPNIRSWVISGFVEKERFDNREDLRVSVVHANGTKLDALEFTDTRHGKFNVEWNAPADPGVYVAELTWRNTSSANILYIPHKTDPGRDEQNLELSSRGGDFIKISRDIFDLREFVRGFGGERYQAHIGKIAPLFADADEAVRDRDESEARQKVSEIRALIERHLPQRSPEAVIQTSYSSGSLNVSGALKKSVEFPEDIYLDVFDQAGELVTTITTTDGPDGMFSRNIAWDFERGTHVVLLSYHDLRVSDFFTVS